MSAHGVYGLVCPQCLGDHLRILKDDIDADGGFIGDPEATCDHCGAVLHVSDLIPVESTSGHTIHLVSA
jgi:hypothetical protein